jgi:hypothetical protein
MSEVAERLDLHDKVYAALMDKVRNDEYPSNQQLDLLEANLVGHEREELVQLLVEKIERCRYPSMDMVRRALRLAG